MQTNYLFIDYENVQPTIPPELTTHRITMLVFLGAGQTKIGVELAMLVHQLGKRATYVRACTAGANALDFHITYYLGLLAGRDATAHFHIVSKDTGFDPLIQHMRTKSIHVYRAADLPELVFLKPARSTNPVPAPPPAAPPPASIAAAPSPAPPAKTPSAPTAKKTTSAPVARPSPSVKTHSIDQVIDDLKKRKQARPRTVSALANTINSVFSMTLSEFEQAALIHTLQQRGLLTIDGTAVTYHLAS